MWSNPSTSFSSSTSSPNSKISAIGLSSISPILYFSFTESQGFSVNCFTLNLIFFFSSSIFMILASITSPSLNSFNTLAALFHASSEIWTKPLFLERSTTSPKSSTSFTVPFITSPTLWAFLNSIHGSSSSCFKLNFIFLFSSSFSITLALTTSFIPNFSIKSETWSHDTSEIWINPVVGPNSSITPKSSTSLTFPSTISPTFTELK